MYIPLIKIVLYSVHIFSVIDDCVEAQPCLNGGECIDLIGDIACRCDNTGYTGDNCEIRG